MDIAIIATKKTKSISRIIGAFKKQGFSRAEFVNVKKLMLLSKGSKTFFQAGNLDLSTFDSVLLLLELSLAGFGEPFLEELERQKIFCNIRLGGMYLNDNEMLQQIQFTTEGCKTTKTICSFTNAGIKNHAAELHYPVIFKSFKVDKKAQTIVIGNKASLVSILNSITIEMDGAMVKEFVEKDLIECAVVGEKVFALKRKLINHSIAPLAKAAPLSLSPEQERQAVMAARACKCNIATVKMVNGFIIRVFPKIDYHIFYQKFGLTFFDEIALYYKTVLEGKPEHQKIKQKSIFDFLKENIERLFYAKQ